MIFSAITTAKALLTIRDKGYVTVFANGNVLHISSEYGELVCSFYDSINDKLYAQAKSFKCATRIRISAKVLFSFINEMRQSGIKIKMI